MAIDEIVALVNSDTSETLDSMIKKTYPYTIVASDTVQKQFISSEQSTTLAAGGEWYLGSFTVLATGTVKISMTHKNPGSSSSYFGIAFQIRDSNGDVLHTVSAGGISYKTVTLSINVKEGEIYYIYIYNSSTGSTTVYCNSCFVGGTFTIVSGNGIVL